MVAGDVGRKGIVRRSKEVNTSVVVRYSDARTVIRNALCDMANEKRIIAAARALFEQKADDTALSAWARDDAAKSIDVLDSLSFIRNQLVGFDFQPAPQAQPYLIIGGVQVSVNCDTLIHREIKGKPSIGGALFRMTKPDDAETEAAKAKRKEMGAYAATLVFMQLEQNLAGNNQPHHEICWSIDIQNSEVHTAPRNYKTRAANLETACEFIAAMWGRV